MEKEDFVKLVRCHGQTFRVDEIVVDTGGKENIGKGTIRIANSRFELDVRIDESQQLIPKPIDISGRSDFWEIRGLIEDSIQFVADGLPSANQFIGENVKGNLKIAFDSMVLKTSAADDPTLKPSDGPAVTFYAILPCFKLIAWNGGTETMERNDFLGESFCSKLDTYHGHICEWNFGLVQRGSDLHVYFRSKPDLVCHEPKDERQFRAFLEALSFIHGRHVWPFRMQYVRNGSVVRDELHLGTEDAASTPHLPFGRGVFLSPNLCGEPWDLRAVLEKAFLFFCADSNLPNEIVRSLYLLREATASGIPKHIALLSLCSLFESLVHAIHKHSIADLESAKHSGFRQAKEETLRFLSEKTSQEIERTGYQRLMKIVSGAAPLNPRLKYNQIIEKFSLSPVADWQDTYRLWEKFRNPISHRMTLQASTKTMLDAESRIAGAINSLVLKLMNYSGPAQTSAYENRYARI